MNQMADIFSYNRCRCSMFALWMFCILLVSVSGSDRNFRGSEQSSNTNVETSVITDKVKIQGTTRRIDEGAFTYYYYDGNSIDGGSVRSESQQDSVSCSTLLLFGVGAAMDSTEYSKLATDIVMEDPSIVTVILDDNPNQIPKQDPKKFARLVHAITTNIPLYIPVCNADGASDSERATPNILLGGHSSSGEGSIAALSQLLSLSSKWYTPSIVGFVGLAPYKIPSDVRIDIPALFWGFSAMTCAVNVQLAADKAYQISNDSHRVLFQVQTHTKKYNPITGGPHCVFSDNGCMNMCNPDEMQWIKGSVATSIALFIRAIQREEIPFNEQTFQTVLPPDTKLFVNQDELTSERFEDDSDTVPIL